MTTIRLSPTAAVLALQALKSFESMTPEDFMELRGSFHLTDSPEGGSYSTYSSSAISKNASRRWILDLKFNHETRNLEVGLGVYDLTRRSHEEPGGEDVGTPFETYKGAGGMRFSVFEKAYVTICDESHPIWDFAQDLWVKVLAAPWRYDVKHADRDARLQEFLLTKEK